MIYFDGINPSSLRLNLYLPSGHPNPGFDSLYRAIHLAELYGIRLIIPFIDWWGYNFWGGLGHGGAATLPDMINDPIANHYFQQNVLRPFM